MTGFRPHLRRSWRTRLLAVAFTVVAPVVGAFVACTTDSSTAVPPVTGILIRAETLTSDRGCGPGPTQLLKYAVVVYAIDGSLVGTFVDGGPAEAQSSSYNVPLTGNVFDCYADGTFVSLPTTNGNATYRLEIFAYNDAAYQRASADIQRGAAVTFDDALLKTTSPTWTTECKASQLENVQVLAICDPLRPGLLGLGSDVAATRITLATQAFNVGGRVATCAPGTDAGADAATDAGDDAGVTDAGEADAAAPSGPFSFSQVRVRPRVGTNVAGPDALVQCPAAYVAEVTPESASYELDVDLLDSAGNLVSTDAQTVCTVTSQVGTTSSAVCP